MTASVAIAHTRRYSGVCLLSRHAMFCPIPGSHGPQRTDRSACRYAFSSMQMQPYAEKARAETGG